VGALPFMGCGDFDIGLMRCKVGRMSVAGELGYEIHCRMGDTSRCAEALLEAGADFGITRIRLQRAPVAAAGEELRHLVAEFTQGYTPGETGMDRWIDWDKGDFIGRAAALAERDGNGPAQKVVTLEVDATMPTPAGSSRSGRTASWPGSSPRAAMATRWASRWPWRWWIPT
jgi:dimethylglycine dehydrogenase